MTTAEMDIESTQDDFYIAADFILCLLNKPVKCKKKY